MKKTEKIKRFLSILQKVENIGENKYRALCPAHDDENPSLSITVKNKKILLHCHAGCETKDILSELGLKFSDLSLKKKSVSHALRNSAQRCNTGCTLEQYSNFKKLPIKFLKKLGLRNSKYGGEISTAIPYFDEDGAEISLRYRKSLTGDNKYRWKTGSQLMLYGLWKIKEAKERKYVVLVEGESDTQTLWYHDIPAIGVPGASNWNEGRDARHFQGIKTIYLVIEPDEGGLAMKKALKESSLLDRIKVLNLRGYKDPSEMYLSSPDDFAENFRDIIKSAKGFGQLLSEETGQKREEAWKLCEPIAENEDILALFYEDLSKTGVAGEKELAESLYLALTTRIFNDPVCIYVKGPSSTGKSWVPEHALLFFPPSSYYTLSAASEKALIYTEECFKHRYVIYFEKTGMKGEFLDYIARSLISEKRISYLTTEGTKEGKFGARRIEKEGPTGFITTTTKVALHPENETRFLSLHSNDSQEQTERVLLKTAIMESEGMAGGGVDFLKWHAFQNWLELSEKRVWIPYIKTVAKLIDKGAPRVRRDFKTLIGFIKAHALIHQRMRKIDSEGRIVANMSDYSHVYPLLAGPLSKGVRVSVPKRIRDTVKAVKKMIGGKAGAEESVSITEIAKELKIDKGTAHRRVKVAIGKGYLRNLEEKQGIASRIVPDRPMPGDKRVLPQPSALMAAYKAGKIIRKNRS